MGNADNNYASFRLLSESRPTKDGGYSVATYAEAHGSTADLAKEAIRAAEGVGRAAADAHLRALGAYDIATKQMLGASRRELEDMRR